MNDNLNQNQTINQNNVTTPPVKKNNNILIIIGGVVIVIIVIIMVLGSLGGGHKNTTGSKEYTGKDVDYNCTTVSNKENGTITTYSDILFNHKRKDSTGTITLYSVRQYNKMVIKYNNGLTDEKYKQVVDALNAVKCYSGTDCTKDHLELEITDFGWNTVVDRKDDEVIISYINLNGANKTLSEKEKKEYYDTLVSSGYTCE